MLEELFIQHSLPWTFSDNREVHEGEVNVYDDSGGVVIYMGDMEDCTYADILLAHAIAALPELLGSLEEMCAAMVRYELDQDEDPPYTHRQMMTRASAALVKAGVKESRNV